MGKEYAIVCENMRNARAAFAIAREAYRVHAIGKAEFLAAKRLYEASAKELDAANAAA